MVHSAVSNPRRDFSFLNQKPIYLETLDTRDVAFPYTKGGRHEYREGVGKIYKVDWGREYEEELGILKSIHPVFPLEEPIIPISINEETWIPERRIILLKGQVEYPAGYRPILIDNHKINGTNITLEVYLSSIPRF